MIRDKKKQILIISFCIIFVIMSIAMSTMSKNIWHKNCCNVTNCNLCAIINIATNYIKNIVFINNSILILIATVPLIQLINKYFTKTKHVTLVELKVIQNK